MSFVFCEGRSAEGWFVDVMGLSFVSCVKGCDRVALGFRLPNVLGLRVFSTSDPRQRQIPATPRDF